MSTTFRELLPLVLMLAAANLCLQLVLGGYLLVFAAFDSLMAPTCELLSLHPKPENEASEPGQNLFRGHRILGRTPISLPQLWFLLFNLNFGMLTKPALLSVLCFCPRHGLRIGDAELLICFECLSGESYRGNRKRGSFSFLPWGAPFFNRILRAQGIPIASREAACS